MRFGKVVREYRKQKGLTTDHVADELDMSVSDYSAIEACAKPLHFEYFVKLCDVLDVPFFSFFISYVEFDGPDLGSSFYYSVCNQANHRKIDVKDYFAECAKQGRFDYMSDVEYTVLMEQIGNNGYMEVEVDVTSLFAYNIAHAKSVLSRTCVSDYDIFVAQFDMGVFRCIHDDKLHSVFDRVKLTPDEFALFDFLCSFFTGKNYYEQVDSHVDWHLVRMVRTLLRIRCFDWSKYTRGLFDEHVSDQE